MKDREFLDESVKYNENLRLGRLDDAEKNLWVMSALNEDDNKPNDAMRCLMIALCIELTSNGIVSRELTEKIHRLRSAEGLDLVMMSRFLVTDLGRSFCWNTQMTLINAIVVFQLCLDGDYEKILRYLGSET